MMTYRQFVETLPPDDSASPSEIERRYGLYKQDFVRRAAHRFFERHRCAGRGVRGGAFAHVRAWVRRHAQSCSHARTHAQSTTRHQEWFREVYDPLTRAERVAHRRADAAAAAARVLVQVGADDGIAKAMEWYELVSPNDADTLAAAKAQAAAKQANGSGSGEGEDGDGAEAKADASTAAGGSGDGDADMGAAGGAGDKGAAAEGDGGNKAAEGDDGGDAKSQGEADGSKGDGADAGAGKEAAGDGKASSGGKDGNATRGSKGNGNSSRRMRTLAECVRALSLAPRPVCQQSHHVSPASVRFGAACPLAGERTRRACSSAT